MGAIVWARDGPDNIRRRGPDTDPARSRGRGARGTSRRRVPKPGGPAPKEPAGSSHGGSPTGKQASGHLGVHSRGSICAFLRKLDGSGLGFEMEPAGGPGREGSGDRVLHTAGAAGGNR